MPRFVSIARLICIGLLLAGLARADTVITMPLPPSPAPMSGSAGISAVSASLVAHFKSSGSASAASPGSDLAQDGLDALERYAARSGRTRNHYMLTGYVPAGGYRTGGSGQFYSSYEGPLGWGWWGSPIIINNYCPGLQQSGCVGLTGIHGSFVGIGSF